MAGEKGKAYTQNPPQLPNYSPHSLGPETSLARVQHHMVIFHSFIFPPLHPLQILDPHPHWPLTPRSHPSEGQVRSSIWPEMVGGEKA